MSADVRDVPVRLDEEVREAVAMVLPLARERGCLVGVLVRDGVPSGLMACRHTLRRELHELLEDAVRKAGSRLMVVLEAAGFDARMRARVRVIALSPQSTSVSWDGAFAIARAPTLDPPAVPREGLRVLVVDDDPVARAVLGGMLSRVDARVSTAEDGAGALAVLQSDPGDLVLLDMAMPRMSGPDVARRVRQVGCTVPIVGVSANRFADDREDCVGAGMNDYLSKPVLPEDLFRMVERWTRI